MLKTHPALYLYDRSVCLVTAGGVEDKVRIDRREVRMAAFVRLSGECEVGTLQGEA